MLYYSLQQKSVPVDFKIATQEGLAPDRGLYYPSELPVLPEGFVAGLKGMSPVEIGCAVMRPFVGDVMPEEVLERIVSETLSFDIPLVRLNADLYVLELFHGPTLAFKDVGARFMSRCLGYFARVEKGEQAAGELTEDKTAVEQGRVVGGVNGGEVKHVDEGRPVTVLVATSGDTGGAVANGFTGVEGVNVVILFPRGKVSQVQELQLTTCGRNVTAIEIDGTFDDCQRMVKEVFADEGLKAACRLTSANSINVARWLPQQIYYWLAFRQWAEEVLPVFVVPSGNFGNICAGLLAHRMGLPAGHFVASCNANDTIPRFMDSGVLEPYAAVATLSNAMDVAVPSNFVRIMELFGQDMPGLKGTLSSVSVSDAETVGALKELHESYGYVADPHTAVGFQAWKDWKAVHPEAKGILLSTAHPLKFAPVIEQVLEMALPLPEEVKALYRLPAHKVVMGADVVAFKAWLAEYA